MWASKSEEPIGEVARTPDTRVCASSGCVALAHEDSAFCIVHLSMAVRGPADVALRCYACGRPIPIGAPWCVKAEGAVHSRTSCLNRPFEPGAHVHRPKNPGLSLVARRTKG